MSDTFNRPAVGVGPPRAQHGLVVGILAHRQRAGVRTATAAIAIGTLAIAEMVIYAAVKTLPERGGPMTTPATLPMSGQEQPRGHNRREAVGRALSATAMTALSTRVALAVVLVLVWASPARAAGPVGVGQLPNVAIDGQGTAHVVWLGTEPLSRSTNYCRVPAGATVCDRTQALQNPGGDTVLRPFIFTDGATVRVLSYRGGAPSVTGLFLWTSSDGGSTFGAPSRAGTLPVHDAIAGPGGAISVSNDAAGRSPTSACRPTAAW